MDVHLLVVQGKPRGKRLKFPRGEFVIGRGPECHVRPDSPSISRQHCLLLVTPNEVVMRDLNSTNGTLINGTRLIGERTLADGDLVQLGPLVLQLRCDPAPAVTTSGPLLGAPAASDTQEVPPPG